jgi:SWIM zinc finger.
MTVIPNLDAVADSEHTYAVFTESLPDRDLEYLNEDYYTVDVAAKTCTCPDNKFHDNRCKHLRRCRILTGHRPIPEWIPEEVSVDPILGANVDKDIRFIMADGGVLDADAETGTETDTTGRPEECTCLACFDADGLPCLACYTQGFSRPNPNAPTKEEESEQAGEEGGQ